MSIKTKKRKNFFEEMSKSLKFSSIPVLNNTNDNQNESVKSDYPITLLQNIKEIKEEKIIEIPQEKVKLNNPLNAKHLTPHLPPSNLETLNIRNSHSTKIKHSSSSSRLIISVFVRGDITQRVFSIWRKSLVKKLPSFSVEVIETINPQSNYLVVPLNSSPEIIENWKKSRSEGNVSYDKIPCVTSAWVIDILKTGHLPSDDSPYIYNSSFICDLNYHPIQSLDITRTKTTQEGVSLSIPLASIDLSYLTSEIPKTNLTNITLKEKIRDSFACAQTGTQGLLLANQNNHITDILEELQDIYDLSGDEWRTQGYKKCIGLLKKLPKIKSIDQIKGIKGIGKNMKEKIKEIIETKQLKKLQYFKDDPKIKSLTELSQIWGVGDKTALNLIKKGFHSVHDLLDHGMHVLTDQQVIGVKYYNEFITKIPRQEVEEIGKTVNSVVQSLYPGSKCTICGSYRRGKPQSGDVDILISPPPDEEDLPHDALPKVLKSLSCMGFLTDHLALPPGYYEALQENPPDDQNPTPFIRKHRSSYMGVCLLPGEGKLHRRIDIKTYPQELLPFAILYFTGSDHFNRSMRLFAKKKGFQLNDKGLKYREKVRFYSDLPYKIGDNIHCTSEEEIFKVLGLEYKRPEDRNVLDVGHLLPPDINLEEDEDQEESEGYQTHDSDSSDYST